MDTWHELFKSSIWENFGTGRIFCNVKNGRLRTCDKDRNLNLLMIGACAGQKSDIRIEACTGQRSD